MNATNIHAHLDQHFLMGSPVKWKQGSNKREIGFSISDSENKADAEIVAIWGTSLK